MNNASQGLLGYSKLCSRRTQKMKLTPCISCLFIAVWPLAAHAQDDLAARLEAASRYQQLVPMAPVVEDTIAKLALRLPHAQRSHFVVNMQVLVDQKAITALVRDAMAKTFTLDELLALNAFYQSKQGALIAQKLPAYNAALGPVLLEELLRSVARYDEAMQGRR